MSLATSLQNVAKTLTSKFGASAVYHRHTSGAYNTTTGKNATPAESTESVSGIISEFAAAQINGTSIKTGDIMFELAATDPGLTAAPVVGDGLAVNGYVYNIVMVTRRDAQGSAVTYLLHLRK